MKVWIPLVVLCGVLLSAPAWAQSVLILSQSQGPQVQEILAQQPDQEWELSTFSGDIASVSAAELAAHDVVVVWTNRLVEPNASNLLGNRLADFVDQGGGVVEMVFTQFEPNPDVRGRWRTQNYACVASVARTGIFTAGSLGDVAVPSHPIMQGVQSLEVGSNRTGETTLLPDANLIASYDDGQILVATREDKPGRVAWLGIYPGDRNQLQGDWQRMLSQAIDWTAQKVAVNPGGPYRIDEGTPETVLTASESGISLRRYAWDLDLDGEYDDAEGPEATLDSSALDGPGVYFVGLEVETTNMLVGQTMVRIQVDNVRPDFTSAAPQQVDIGGVYRYQARAEDPAGDADPLTYDLEESPQGATIDDTGLVTWTPTSEDLEASFAFALTVTDDDGDSDSQSWEVSLRIPDSDGDGILDADDNCPGLSNPQQGDLDGDTIGDRCDTDIDGDGLTQREETINGSNPESTDTDGDGIDDGREVNDLGTDPNAIDSDEDGLSDPDELAFGSDPASADGDEDGLSDQQEQEQGTNPRNPDTDMDTLLDGEELTYGSDPTLADTDGDGVSDGEEVRMGRNPNGDGFLEGAEPPPPTGSPAEGGGCQQSPSSPLTSFPLMIGFLLMMGPVIIRSNR